MLPDRVSNPEPLTYESGALPIVLRGPHDMSDNTVELQWFTKAFLKVLVLEL